MNVIFALCIPALLLEAVPAGAQDTAAKPGTVPIYSVTVVSRTTKAVNYEYRTGPTKIDFRGTVLLPKGKGEATVESQRGRTEIQVHFDNLTAPTQYGREYLTYTLWAITPEGAPRNLGEVIPGGNDKATLRVTTDLQAFGLIVTAEPYASSRQPSDVVVLENEVRADTIGTSQPIEARYELMPRGHYTWHMPDSLTPVPPTGPKVSMGQYEAQLQIYEAQNAIGVARSADAVRYAPNTIGKAETLLQQAQNLQASKAPTSVIVQNAREAAQTAEDARQIAERRRQEEKLASAEQEVASLKREKEQAQNEARRAAADADAARNRSEADRSVRVQAETNAAEATTRAAQAVQQQAPVVIVQPAPPQAEPRAQADLRMRLVEQLNGVLPARDTPRGLVITINDSAFRGTELREPAIAQVARLAAVLSSQAHLKIDVEGYADTASASSMSSSRAEAVQRVLASRGLGGSMVTARGLGDARPLVSNSSPAGREQNRRVEVVISGEAIGSLPYWDRTYSLLPRQ